MPWRWSTFWITYQKICEAPWYHYHQSNLQIIYTHLLLLCLIRLTALQFNIVRKGCLNHATPQMLRKGSLAIIIFLMGVRQQCPLFWGDLAPLEPERLHKMSHHNMYSKNCIFNVCMIEKIVILTCSGSEINDFIIIIIITVWHFRWFRIYKNALKL